MFSGYKDLRGNTLKTFSAIRLKYVGMGFLSGMAFLLSMILLVNLGLAERILGCVL